MYRYIYGPVPSRRLGISLGIDLVPNKVCTFNCVYCECGRSTKLTLERKEYNPIQEILREIRDFLSNNPMPDFLSLSGSGEPTLHSKIGYLINQIKTEFPPAKIAVLTNGSLLFKKDVRDDLLNADIILPSLDAADDKAYKLIDRPHPKLDLNSIIKGIAESTGELKAKDRAKQVWLEIFIVEGINTDNKNIDKLRGAILLIKPDKIQLNTLDRPGTEEWVKPASTGVLESIKDMLDLPDVEIISRYKQRKEIKAYRQDIENAILDTVERRPSTLQDLALILGQPIPVVEKYIDILEFDGKINSEVSMKDSGRGIFYKIGK